MSATKVAAAAAIATCFLASLPLSAGANELQFDEPMRIIAPAAPGGILDQTSRLVAEALSEVTKQTVIVENAPGAGGTIGMQAMLRAKPDGNPPTPIARRSKAPAIHRAYFSRRCIPVHSAAACA